jgi:elongation factor 1-gamma
MILHTFLGDSSTAKILACASLCGVDLTINIVKLNDLRTKEFKKKLTLQKLPILDVDEENSLAESSAIIKLLARKNVAKAYGKDEYHQALTDQWLDVNEQELEPAALALTATLQGHIHFDKQAQKLAQDDFMKACTLLNTQLGKSKFLTGAEPTVADYSIFCNLASVLRCSISGNAVNKLSHLKAWIDALINDPHVVRAMGKIVFCTKPFAVPPAEEEDA